MRNYQVKEIYSLFKGDIPFSKEEFEKYSDILNQHLEIKETYLFINDNRECENLTDVEMKEKYDSGEYFNSGMFKNDEEFNKYQNDSSSNIYDFVDYRTFCIYNEIKALRYFKKDINEIIGILNEKYNLNI